MLSRFFIPAFLFAGALLSQSCAMIAGSSPDQAAGKMVSVPKPTVSRASLTGKKMPQKSTQPGDAQIGQASWYGKDFAGKPTASGEIFNHEFHTAAHRTLPLGSRVRVTNLANGKSVEVRINDRGPYVGGRIIDLSRAAARALDMVDDGVTEVRVETLSLPEDTQSASKE